MKLGSKKFIIALFLAVIIFNTAPLIYQWFKMPSDKVFVGAYPIIFDKPQYLSQMVQGAEGHWLIKNKFTSESQNEVFIYTFYVFLGHVAGLFKISVETMFLIARFVFGIMLFSSIIYFINFFILESRQRKIAYLLTFFASGIGFLGLAGSSLDLWMPDFIPIARFLYFPHMVFANNLMLLAVLFVYRSFKENKMIFAVSAGASGFILNFVLTFHMVVLYPLMLIFWLWHFLENKNRRLVHFKNFIIFCLLSVPSFLYMAYLGFINPIWKLVEKQNILLSPPPVNILTGYGLIFIFFVLGIYSLYKKKQLQDNIILLLWLFIGFLSAYAPIQMQRRGLETGLYIPMAIVASYGVVRAYNFLRERTIDSIYLVLFSVPIFIILLFGNIYNWIQFTDRMNKHDDLRYFVPKENVEAMAWLAKNSSTDNVVLSSFYNGNLIPYYADRVVYIGHGPATIDLERKFLETSKFFAGDLSLEDAAAFLKEKRIDLVFWSSDEKWMSEHGFNPDDYDFLEQIYKVGNVSIYKFKEANGL